MDMYKICLFLLVIIVAQLVTHYKERRDLYDRITGAPPKKNVKPPSTPKSAHEKALEEWRKRQEKAWDSGSIRNALPRKDMQFMIPVPQAVVWVLQEHSGRLL